MTCSTCHGECPTGTFLAHHSAGYKWRSLFGIKKSLDISCKMDGNRRLISKICLPLPPETHKFIHNCYDFPSFYVLKNIKSLEVGNLPSSHSQISLLLLSVSTVASYNQLQNSFPFKTRLQWWDFFSFVKCYL